MSGYRYSEQRRFETIESHRLPIVGATGRHRQRAAAWRRIAVCVLLFWAGTFVAIVCG